MEMHALNSDRCMSPLQFADLCELFDSDTAGDCSLTDDSLPRVQDCEDSSLHFLLSSDSFFPAAAEAELSAVVPLSSFSEETHNSVSAVWEATLKSADAFSFVSDASANAESCRSSAKKNRAKAKPKEAQNGTQEAKRLQNGFSGILSREALADGYEWLKYGTKSLKCTPHLRTYYKCSVQKCSAKRRVERDSNDGRIFSVTYKGFHNHDSPATYCIVDIESFHGK